ncbi:Helix-turn-helix domain-containing protein [Nocardia amikacinitolerans]|uniref:MmyB family transcriptional regulator n=1 Tax=Nocardia amikacinitolerans TaxID=756689 RepID=UPI00082CE777|nr:helix-turn-helix domain-containing protein [Nocardia amikacinitolerans]MCP2320944.1 Helix-turn-helix domain-containing protein [Nocardia amikacinitolerans]
MQEAPILDEMPDFHDTLEFLRLRDRRSRSDVARSAHISTSHLDKIIANRTIPGPNAFAKLTDAFDLEPAQRQHLYELWQPSRALPHAEELRQRLTIAGVQTYLDDLNTRDVLAVCVDPLRTVLHGNRIFHRTVPGLAEADNNFGLWMFSPAARDNVVNWESEIRYTVAILRGTLGRYRDHPRAQSLFRKLRATPEFPRLWDTSPMQVAYGCHRLAPINLHAPWTNQPRSLSLAISEYGESPDVLIAYGVFDTHAIAC